MTAITSTTATVTVPALELEVEAKGIRVRIDEGRAPYIEAEVRIPMPDSETLEALDPRDNLRVQISVEQTWTAPVRAPQTRDFDLRLHAIREDFVNGEVTLTLESDESILLDAGNHTTAVRHFDVESPLRDIVDEILDDVGLDPLEAGSDDFSFHTDRTNLIPNPSFETDTASWTSARLTLARVSTQQYVGTYSLQGTVNATDANWYAITSDSDRIAVRPNTTYYLSSRLRSSVAITAAMQFYQYPDTSGSLISSLTTSTTAVAANTWTHVAGSLTTGPTTNYVRVTVARTAAGAIGNTMHLDAVGLFESHTPVPYFDGATTDTPDYAYAWTGTSHASTSTRTALTNRADTSAFELEPGEVYFDFLRALLQVSGLRLYADETRAWRLVDLASYTVPGVISISGEVNAYTATDGISLQDGLFYDAVVVVYRWTDASGTQQTSYDAAVASGGGTKLKRVEWDRPYPGPGAAATILAAAQGRGRTLDLTASLDLRTTPGQILIADIEGLPTQVGAVASVEFVLDETGDTMRVGSRGLTETPDEAWILAEGEWPDHPETWNTYAP